MSAYEEQTQATAQFYDRQIRAAEAEPVTTLSTVVAGSQMHAKTHNPIDEGIDEG